MLPRPRIEQVETFASHSSVFCRITTESGIRGVGESTAFAFPLAVVAVIDALRPSLIGADPLEVGKIWLKSYRALGWRGLTLGGAISAIDQALWDFRGHYYEEPVWQLLGGRVRDGVRAMKVLPTGTIDEVARAMASAGANEGERFGRVGDRREAIARALDLAQSGDLVLLAGKGHESTIERASGPVPWDERAVAADLIAERFET